MITIPDAAEGLKAIAQEKLAWLNDQMEGKEYICNNRFTLADVMLFCFLNFGTTVGQGINPESKNLASWYEKVEKRPSSKA